jgi:hypothetical protein
MTLAQRLAGGGVSAAQPLDQRLIANFNRRPGPGVQLQRHGSLWAACHDPKRLIPPFIVSAFAVSA